MGSGSNPPSRPLLDGAAAGTGNDAGTVVGCTSLFESFFFFSDVPGGGEGDGEGDVGRGREDGLAGWGVLGALRTLVGQFEDELEGAAGVDREARRSEA